MLPTKPPLQKPNKPAPEPAQFESFTIAGHEIGNANAKPPTYVVVDELAG